MGGSGDKESSCKAGDLGPSLGWEDPLEEGMLTVFLPGESHVAWRATVHGMADTTEPHTHTHTHTRGRHRRLTPHTHTHARGRHREINSPYEEVEARVES